MATILSGYLQCFFRVSAVLFLGVSWGTSLWVGCFHKSVGHRVSSCASVLVFSWGYLIIYERQCFRACFSGYFLLLFIIIFILLSISVWSLCTRFGFLQLPHTYVTVVSGLVSLNLYVSWFSLVDMLLSINLYSVILLSFTLKTFFLQDFNILL